MPDKRMSVQERIEKLADGYLEVGKDQNPNAEYNFDDEKKAEIKRRILEVINDADKQHKEIDRLASLTPSRGRDGPYAFKDSKISAEMHRKIRAILQLDD